MSQYFGFNVKISQNFGILMSKLVKFSQNFVIKIENW